jgi:DNA polymerase III subunit gamma/tau
MSLDTKYRPRAYSDVLGQKVTINTLKGFIKSGAGWRQSYLFAGPYGSGKTTLGRIMARALLCSSPNEGEPCDECDSCKAMLEGSHDSFVEVDAATNSGKADVKKLLEELGYSSFSGNKKLYLFDESHQLSKDALDALLKPMEENDRGSFDKKLVVIFATTEPEKMRQTVLSRCAPAFIIKPVSSEEIADRLAWVCDQEGFTHEREALVLIADFTEGHIRDALKAIEGVASSNERHVGLSGVKAYLHVERNDVVCKMLLAENAEALSLAEDLLLSTPVGVAYDRLMGASMMAVSMGMGASTPPPFWNKELLKQAWDKHQLNLLTLADSLASRPLRPTSAMFKCDLLKWKMGGVPTMVMGMLNQPINNEPSVEPVIEDRQISLSDFVTMVKRELKALP